MNQQRFQLLWLLGEHAREKGQAERAQQFYKAALAERGLDLETILSGTEAAASYHSGGDDHNQLWCFHQSALAN